MYKLKKNAINLKYNLKLLLSNPIFGSIGWIVAVLFGCCTYYFYSDVQNPELSYLVKPVRTIIVRSEYKSKIDVYYENNLIESDLTAAQIILWNNGRVPIRKENILTNITIKTENNISILEAKIIKTTRKIVQAELDTSRLSEGIVGVNWSNLEENDGINVQIIYAETPNLKISASGVVHGQKQIKRVETPEPTIHRREFNRSLRKSYEIYMLFIVGMGVFGILMLIIMIYLENDIFPKSFSVTSIIIMIIFMLVIFYGYLYEYVEPPFGF